MTMKAIMQSRWSRRLLFFLAGLILATLCLVVTFRWMNIVPYHSFNAQPLWLKGLNRLVVWLPWIAFAVVLILRFVKGRNFHVVFYLLGTITPVALVIGYLVLEGPGPICFITRSSIPNFGTIKRTPSMTHSGRLAFAWWTILFPVTHLMALTRTKSSGFSAFHEMPHQLAPLNGITTLGLHSGFCGIDSEWLFITFGHDGRVDRYWLYTD